VEIESIDIGATKPFITTRDAVKRWPGIVTCPRVFLQSNSNLCDIRKRA